MAAGLARGGCVVAGAAGVGKTRLAAEAVARSRAATVHVLATASAAALPFGAFGHLLPANAAGGSIPEYLAHLRGFAAPEPPTLVVDDAHLLDDASAALLLAASASGAARVLATLRTGERAPDAVTALWKDQGLERFELLPLGPPDVRGLVVALLAGPAHTEVFERIHDLSQGNPLYVHELVHDARRTGALHLLDGRWYWREELLAFDRLAVLLERHLHEVGPDARRALELLAVGAPLPYLLLTELASADGVEELEEMDLVDVRRSGSDVHVVAAHPLYTEVVAAELPQTRVRRLRRELARAFDTVADPDPVDRLRVALWLLDAGDGDPSHFLSASELAMQRSAPGVALRLAEAAGDDFDSALAQAVALNALARFNDAEQVLAVHEHEAVSAPERRSVQYVVARFRGLLRSAGEADRRPEAFLERAAAWHEGPGWKALIAGQWGWVALYDGRPAAALAAVDPYLLSPDVEPVVRLDLLAVRIQALARLDRADDGLAATAAFAAIGAELPVPPWELGIAMTLFELSWPARAGRDLDGTEARLREVLAAVGGGRAGGLQLAAAQLGEVALLRGHGHEAIGWFEQAFDGLATGDPLNQGIYVLASLVKARAMIGDVGGAERAVGELERRAAALPRVATRAEPVLRYARAVLEAARGRLSAAATQQLALASAGLEHPAVEIDAFYDAVRYGADPGAVVDQLHVVVDGVQNDVAMLQLRHVRALAAGDGPGLLTVARELAGRGIDLWAAEAATHAASAFHDEGRAASAREAGAVAAKHAAACPGVRSPVLAAAMDGPKLTPRELEVALLAARGDSNREIAGSLVLSVRTVESCVLRACRKLGVTSRKELDSVLSPAPGR